MTHTTTIPTALAMTGLNFYQKMIRLVKNLHESEHVQDTLDELYKMPINFRAVNYFDIKELLKKVMPDSAPVPPTDPIARSAILLIRKIELLEKTDLMKHNLKGKERPQKRAHGATAKPIVLHQRTAPITIVPNPRDALLPAQQRQIPRTAPVKKTNSMDQKKFLEMLIAKNRQKSEQTKEYQKRRCAKIILSEALPMVPPPAKKAKN